MYVQKELSLGKTKELKLMRTCRHDLCVNHMSPGNDTVVYARVSETLRALCLGELTFNSRASYEGAAALLLNQITVRTQVLDGSPL